MQKFNVIASKYKVNDQYWGSCQQLRCGKVISDYLNDGQGKAMDPIFGVLLCPYGGKRICLVKISLTDNSLD